MHEHQLTNDVDILDVASLLAGEKVRLAIGQIDSTNCLKLANESLLEASSGTAMFVFGDVQCFYYIVVYVVWLCGFKIYVRIIFCSAGGRTLFVSVTSTSGDDSLVCFIFKIIKIKLQHEKNVLISFFHLARRLFAVASAIKRHYCRDCSGERVGSSWLSMHR